MISLAVGGGYRQRWQEVSANPVFTPVLALSAVSIAVALLLPRPAGEFWSGLLHYQIYLFLLLFLAAGGGAWQQRGANFLYAAAGIAATLLYCAYFQLLPEITLFRSYVIYQGNKSILLAILMAVAAGWLLEALLRRPGQRLRYLALFVYVVVAQVLLSKSRTASVIMLTLCTLPALARMRFGWRSLAGLTIAAVAVVAALSYALSLPTPEKCAVHDMVGYSPAHIAADRGLCTIHQVRAFAQGKNAGEDGMRAEIYRLTAQIVAEQPWTGHGVGSWLPEYQARAKGLVSGTMTTPHNDYLLYATEIGVFGVAALLWIWLTQLMVARRIGGEQGMHLAMLTVTTCIGGMFNAILRDAVFGMAFMILLAIPLAGQVNKNKTK
jgi:hypothetical protein